MRKESQKSQSQSQKPIKTMQSNKLKQYLKNTYGIMLSDLEAEYIKIIAERERKRELLTSIMNLKTKYQKS